MDSLKPNADWSYDGAAGSSGEVGAPDSRDTNSPSQSQRDDAEDTDGASVTTDFTESTNVPKRRIGLMQVTSLMINQMVGSGIFETPAIVLFLTGSKPISLALWGLGGIYSLMSGLMYLEYSTALPWNGGPLIWLDETFHRPPMLAATIFAWFWIVLCTSQNCDTVALYLVGLIYPETIWADTNWGLVRFLSIVVQTLACLCLYFVRRLCFMLNNVFAVFKVVALLVFFVAGMVASHRDGSGLTDFSTRQPGGGGLNSFAAMVYVILSYQGWEHTNYIAGEIRNQKAVLRKGVILAITIVSVLYMLVTSAYYVALSYATIEDSTLSINQIGIAEVLGGGRAAKIIVLISAWSQVVAYSYTSAKVKQAIAWQRIIPFYKFFGRQDAQFDSPGGALVLHWFFTCLPHFLVPINNVSDSFNAGLFTYGYQIEMLFLGVGLLRLSRRMKLLDEKWRPVYLRSKFTLYTFVAIFTGFNTAIVVTVALPRPLGQLPSFYWPVAIAALVTAASVYWGVLQMLQSSWGGEKPLGERFGFHVRICSQDDDDIPESLTGLMKVAVEDGSRRRVEYRATGRLAKIIKGVGNGFKRVARWLEY